MLLCLHTAAGMNPVRRVPGSKEAASRPLAQTVSVSPALDVSPYFRPLPADSCRLLQQGLPQARACQPQTAPVPPHQHRSLVPLFQEPCQFAGTLVPRINAGATLTGWAVPAQATEAVCPHTSSVSSAAPGSPRSPFRGAPESAAPHFQTASVANAPLASLVPRPWSLADSLPAPTTPPTFLPSMRLPTTKAPKLTYASAAVPHRAASPARRRGKGNIHIHLEAAAGAAAGTNTLGAPYEYTLS